MKRRGRAGVPYVLRSSGRRDEDLRSWAAGRRLPPQLSYRAGEVYWRRKTVARWEPTRVIFPGLFTAWFVARSLGRFLSPFLFLQVHARMTTLLHWRKRPIKLKKDYSFSISFLFFLSFCHDTSFLFFYFYVFIALTIFYYNLYLIVISIFPDPVADFFSFFIITVG